MSLVDIVDVHYPKCLINSLQQPSYAANINQVLQTVHSLEHMLITGGTNYTHSSELPGVLQYVVRTVYQWPGVVGPYKVSVWIALCAGKVNMVR